MIEPVAGRDKGNIASAVHPKGWVCIQCGKQRRRGRGSTRRLFCSQKCYMAYRWAGRSRVVNCARCGAELRRSLSQIKGKNYCDRTCRGRAQAEIVREVAKRQPKVQLTCPSCLKLYLVPPCRSGQRYCSRPCKHQSQSQKITIACRACGQEKQRPPSSLKWGRIRGARSFFCSRQCKNQFNRGPCSPNWIADRSALKREDKSLRESVQMKDWRRAVYRRDNYRCQMCGDRSRKGHSVTLNPHHIQRFVDRPDLALAASNGITLCEECHRQIQGREQVFAETFRVYALQNERFPEVPTTC